MNENNENLDWLVFLGPISLTFGQLIVGTVIHKFVRKMIWAEQKRPFTDNRSQNVGWTSDDMKMLSNLYVQVGHFILSIATLLFLAFIYQDAVFEPGSIAQRFIYYGLLVVGIGFLFWLLLDDERRNRFIRVEDFTDQAGGSLLPPRTVFNYARWIVSFASYGLAWLIYRRLSGSS